MSDNNPNKKIRLDFQNKKDRNMGNEDLWGQDDLTAEEFDMLEIQATQSCNQNITSENFFLNKASETKNNSIIKVEDLKQLQYELEGRVKLLSHSLEKSEKVLTEERLNRELLINERMKEFYKRETNLQKEVEKMQSILEFKDQEMKITYSKLQMMKSQLQLKKPTDTETTGNISFGDILNSSKSDSNGHFSKHNFPKKFHRKYKLVTDTPKGEAKGIDILSSILCTKLALPSFPSYEYRMNKVGLQQYFPSNFCASASVMKLKNEQKSYELLEYYSCFLKNHVAMLKTASSKNNPASCNKSPPISSKRKEAGYSQTVVSYLHDVAYIFSCSKSNPIMERNCISKNHSENVEIQKVEIQSSCDPFSKTNLEDSVDAFSQIVQSLSALSNPKTYPNGYSKKEEMEYALVALLIICSSNPEKFLVSIDELPIHSFLNPLQNVTAVCTTLKLLTVLCCCKNFISFLIHKNSNCIFCLISDYLINIVPHYLESFAECILLVQDFFSLVFTTPKFLDTLLESSKCISEAIQGIIISVWKYCKVKEKISLSAEIIKKGLILLHYMSCCIPSFKEMRNSVENEYISLISSMLAFSKENIEFREFYDLIHSLWDFQTDITEFDLDDLSEETQNSADDMDVALS